MKTALLGDILKLEYGKPLQRDKRKTDGKYPAYGANGIKAWSDHFYYEKPSIIVGRKGSAGEITLVDGKFWPLDVTYYVVTDESKYDLRYLFNLLQTQNLPSLAKGVKPGINRNEVYALSVNIPDTLTEQKRIVKKLDQAFKAIKKAKENYVKNLINAKELFAAEGSFIFLSLKKSAEMKFLPDISKNLDSRRTPITKSLRESGDIPYYGASGVVDHVKDYIFNEDILLISEDGANLLARTTPIAFSVSGKAWVNNHAHVLGFENPATQKFIEFYINSIDLSNFITGTAQPKLNQSKLNKVPVFMPSLEKQKEAVVRLQQIQSKTQKLQKLYNQKLNNLEELKQSILKQAFEGKL